MAAILTALPTTIWTDDDALDGEGLEHREGDVARSRGHVDEQEVEIAPGALAPELLEGACHDRAAPDHRVGLVLEHEVRAHDLDAADGLGGHEQVVPCGGVHAREAEHLGDRRTGEVGVEDAHAVAAALELDGEHAADERLAHTALAGDHAHDVLDVGLGALLEELRALIGRLLLVA